MHANNFIKQIAQRGRSRGERRQLNGHVFSIDERVCESVCEACGNGSVMEIVDMSSMSQAKQRQQHAGSATNNKHMGRECELGRGKGTGKENGNGKGIWELGTGNGNGKNINDALLVPRIHHITCLATPVGYMPRRVASRRYNPLASPRRLLLPLFPTSTSFALSCSKHATVNDIRKRPLLLLAACHKLAETDSGDGEGDGGDRQAH